MTAVWYSSGDPGAHLLPYTGGPLEVRLRIVSTVARRLERLAVILFDKGGTKLVNADTISAGETIELEAGANVVGLRIPELYLNPGVYVLGWWLATPATRVFDFVEASVDLEVVDRDAARLHRRASFDGAVLCRLEVTSVQAAPG